MSRLGVSVIDWSEDAAANEPRGVRDRNSRLNQSAFSWHLLQGFRKKVNDLCPACNLTKNYLFAISNKAIHFKFEIKSVFPN